MSTQSTFSSPDQPTHEPAEVNPTTAGDANPPFSIHEGIPTLRSEVRYQVTDENFVRYAGDNEREAWATFDHLTCCNHEAEIFYHGMRVRSSNDGEG